MTSPAKPNAPIVLSGRDVTAVLGPTNTGKTHLAIERMVAHESGLIGLPLRLLAREVYGQLCARVGAHKVALVTGEEKIVPAGAKYSVCTVEAMPRETDAAFVAIDEVQIAADLERGHIFTDRILHLRGRQETLLLGAATMRGILERLLRGVSVVTRPRLSQLSYAGSKKLTRLPPRSAIVAFSADEVYAIGELIRRQRGGAAVVLGALSPRTRNAQVALYQNGDVDYLVATDAIGMGLNLDVDHVAFAQNRKFDGFQFRDLTAAELAQIAGRAGRHMRDGTFGVTARVDPFADELVEKIEGHDFDPVKVLQWRTAEFEFSSVEALLRSIETVAPLDGLTRALPAVDAQALERLVRQADIRDVAQGRERVALLWDACALPDYRRIAPAQHADLVSSIYLDLARRGHVDEDYMAEQVRRANSTEGDIDALSHRIAEIRTWTFVANRPGWLADAAHWQEKTREIEDSLSDALHERLTKRFVDRRTSVLMRRLRENTMLEAEISPAGTVTVEGHHVGELQGFRFTADQSADGDDAKAIRTAAQKALATEFERRAERFATSANGDIALASDGILRWIGAPIGTLTAGEDALKPRVILLADEQLTGPARDKVAARAERFVHFQIETLLKPLTDLRDAEQLSGIAKGIAFRLVEAFGLIPRRDVAEEMRALDQDGRAALRRLGVRFGAYHVFVPALLKPAPASLVTLLWALKNDGKDKPGFGDIVHALAAGRTSVVVNQSFDRDFYRLAGFRMLGRRAVRVDILERLADLIRPALAWRAGSGQRPDGAYDGAAFMVTPAMMSILGATADDIEEILKGLGYRGEAKPADEVKAKLAAIDAEAEAALHAKMEAEAKAKAEAKDGAAAEAPPAAEAQGEAAVDAPAEADGDITGPAIEVDGGGAADAEAAGPDADTVPATDADVAPTPDEAREAVADTTVSPSDPATVADAALSSPVDGEAAEEVAEASIGQDDGEAASQQAAEPTSSSSAEDNALPEGEEKTEAEEPKPVMLWRPARFENRPRHGQRNRHGRDARPGADARPARQGEGERQEQGPGNRGGGKQRFGKKGKPGGRGDGKGSAQGAGARDGQDRRNGGGKPWAQNRPREERAPRVDPDSPFAKLAALRDQLKK